jgi:type I restriction enzyme S subunit
MGNSLNELRLEDCMDAIIDYRGKTPKKTNSGIPLITAKIIKNGQIQEVKEFIAESDYESWMRRGTPEAGDVVLTTEAPLGEVAQLDDRKIALAQRVITLRGKKGLLDNDYLKYLLLSNDVQHQLDGRGTGTTVKGIKQSELREIILKFPDLSIQKSIAYILKTLDDKIELNRQTNQTLEQMAQTLFKSWFVDFDPVFDNALAAGSNVSDFPEALQQRALLRQERRKQAQQLAASPKTKSKPLPDEIRNLFPSEFEQTDEPSIGINGWIPKGWESCSMSEIVDIASSKRVFAKDYVEEGVPFFRGKEITQLSQGIKINTEIFISEEKYQELKEKAGAPKQGDILITSVGTIGNTYLVKESDKFYFKDGNLTWIKSYKKGFIPFYMKEWFSSKQGKDAIERIKIGTTQQAITIKALNGIVILSPEDKVVQVFENHAASIFDKHDANIEQIDNLSKLRNTLLPKLISGELTIPDTIKTENNANHQQPKEPLSHHA